MFSKALAFSTVVLASQASALSLTVPCLTTFAGLATGNASSCLNVLGLPGLFTTNGSIVSPLNSYLSGWCPAPACSNATLFTSLQSLETGCPAELGSLGFSISNTTSPALLDTYFSETKSLACLQNSNSTGYNSTYCVTETLYGLQGLTGIQFTLPEVLSIVNGNYTFLMNAILPVATASPANLTSVLCTPCVKGIYTELTGFYSGVNSTTIPLNSSSPTLGSLVGSLCGSSFLNGSIPSTIQNTTVNATLASIAAHSATASASAGTGSGTSGAFRNMASVGGLVAVFVGSIAVVVL